MQRFILRQNIELFRKRLLEQWSEHDTHLLKVMLAQALRDLAILEATLTSAAKVAGSCMFDVFPDNPSDEEADGVSNLYASFKHAAEKGVPNAMHIQRYDVRDASGLFVTKFWKPVNTPIFDAEGRLVYLLHQVEDVTEAIQKNMTGAVGRS